MIIGKRTDTGQPITCALSPGNHVLVTGITGFGKTNQVNYFLYQLASNPHVAFILCNSAGKPDYMQWLPRATNIALGKLATDKALKNVLELMQTRFAQLYPDISDDMSLDEAIAFASVIDRQITITRDMPLIFLVVDEFVHYLASTGGKARIDTLIEIISIGRAAGVQVVLSTQRPSDELAKTDIREQLPVRILFAADANSAVMSFGPDGRGLPVDKITVRGMGYAMTEGDRFPVKFIAPECPESAVRLAAARHADARPLIPGVRRFLTDRNVAA